MYKVNDFFCGAGGMGLGFKNAGFEIVGSWDFDKYAVESYKENVSEKVIQADISKMTWVDIPKADVWTFGFPCQDISVAGKQAGMIKGKTRSGLFYEIMRLLDETEIYTIDRSPKIILAENVKAVKKYLPEIEKEYLSRGYKAYSVLYNSKNFGVPQNRERYFILGVHESIEKDFSFLDQKTNYKPNILEVLEKSVDKKYYLSEKIASDIFAAMDKEIYSNDLITPYPTLKDRSSYAITTRTYACYLQHHVKRKLATLVIENNGESPVIRKFTPKESLMLQGFPEDYKLVVSDAQIYKQAGNAVTVNVAHSIAEQIKNFLDGPKEENTCQK